MSKEGQDGKFSQIHHGRILGIGIALYQIRAPINYACINHIYYFNFKHMADKENVGTDTMLIMVCIPCIASSLVLSGHNWRLWATLVTVLINRLGANTRSSGLEKHTPFSKYHNFPKISPKDKN